MSETIDSSKKDVIEHLYLELGKYLLAKAHSIVKRTQIAQEIVQEVFFKLWKSNLVFPNKKSVFVWTYKVCHSTSIDYLRSSSNKNEFLQDDLPALEIGDNADLLQDIINREHLNQLVGFLPKRDLEIFFYVYLDEMTQNEVAELMGISRKTVQRTLQVIKEKSFDKEIV